MKPRLLATALLCTTAAAQGVVCPTGVQLKNDDFPLDPSGSTQFAVIQGLCPGDRAASVFDIRGLPGPASVLSGGLLFGGPPGSQPAMATLEIYDGITFLPTGQAVPGPQVFQGQSTSLTPNMITMLPVTNPNVQITSGILVVALRMDSNPNELIPGFGCLAGYTANFTSDVQSVLPTCTSRPELHLIFDTNSATWWDVTRFRIGGTAVCPLAFNGNWIMRACIELPAGSYAGTGEDMAILTGVDPFAADDRVIKSVKPGDRLTLAIDSPGGTYLGAPSALFVDFFRTAGPPLTPFFPSLHVSAGFLSVPIVVPSTSNFGMPGPFGVSVMFQAVTVSLTANNGLYLTSDSHVILIR